MTGPLRNPRHERFVALLLEGKSATDAHEEAGYVRDDGNATRLRRNPRICERLAQLQAEVAAETKVTVESLLAELEAARQKATDLDQLSAAVRAIEAKAKVSGLLIQRTEVGGAGEFSRCQTIEEVADEMLTYETFHVPPSRQDRQGLVDLLTEQFAAVQEYIAAIKARPVTAVNPRRSQRQQELAR